MSVSPSLKEMHRVIELGVPRSMAVQAVGACSICPRHTDS